MVAVVEEAVELRWKFWVLEEEEEEGELKVPRRELGFEDSRTRSLMLLAEGGFEEVEPRPFRCELSFLRYITGKETSVQR